MPAEVSAAPVGGRIPTLDVLRGLAILGTFAANVWLFAAPQGPGVVFLGGAEAGTVESVLRAMVNGKFLALLTLLFGVGMELQYRAAVRRGMRWPGRYLWRAALLLVEGALHYILVFEFDVLMGYAIASMIVAFLVGRSARVQNAVAGVAGAVLLLLVAGITLSGGTGGGVTLPPYPADYPGQVLVRLAEWGLYRIELVLIVPFAVVMFVVGVRLTRAGAFAAAGTRIRRRMLVVGAAGVLLNVLGSLSGPTWFAVDRYVSAAMVACGLAAAVTAVVHGMRPAPGPVRRGLVAIGRTAMTCYVLQNLVAGIVFHAWGLGLADGLSDMDTVDPGLRVAVVVLVWAAVCAGSAVGMAFWLRRFDRGPLELATHAALGRSRSPVTVAAGR